VLQREAEEKLRVNQSLLAEVEQNIDLYNASISSVNACLEVMSCDRQKLPLLELTTLPLPTGSVNQTAVTV
jgi:hypothetical protein